MGIYDFQKMVQINTDTCKERKIRQPRKWKAPSKPLVPAGPTTVVNVPPGSAGTTIQVPHPVVKGAYISVQVPASAKPGQAMLVPVPPVSAGDAAPDKHAAAGTSASSSAKGKSGGSWSTGAKVAAGTAALAGAG